MKFTLFLTRRCNLACTYCYVGKDNTTMSLELAARIVDWALTRTPPTEDVDLGFFGGEPLLEFGLLQTVTRMVKDHARYDPARVKLSVVTNGTLMNEEIALFLRQHQIGVTISCDGPPAVHDRWRRFPDGSATSSRVEGGIRTALAVLERAPVNAVYRPESLMHLPEVIDYFSELGVRQIYLNPDFSADWTNAIVDVPSAYRSVAERYLRFYREGRPRFISPIDGKITVMLRGGYQPLERCRMGSGEFAFDPSGRVFPCERLASRAPEEHAIGSADDLIQLRPPRRHLAPGPPIDASCLECSVRDYCANWCGCSNYFSTGFYNRVGPFLCTSEQTWLRLALQVFQTLESELGPTFMEHLGGKGVANSTIDLPLA